MPSQSIPVLTPTQIERFWAKVAIGGPDECWPWLGARGRGGYGRVRVGGRAIKSPVNAQRVAFTISHGSPVGDAHVCHRCDNPPCCNPAHLFLGTPSDNISDCYAKQRRPTGCRHIFGRTDHQGSQNGTARLREGDVLRIRQRYAAREATPTQLAREHGVAIQTIWHVIYRRTWRHI